MNTHQIVWAYEVRPECREAFLNAYRSNGVWAKLFSQADGYLGTQLFEDSDQPNRFLTVDTWQHEADFDRFKAQFKKPYAALDQQCETFTLSESQIL